MQAGQSLGGCRLHHPAALRSQQPQQAARRCTQVPWSRCSPGAIASGDSRTATLERTGPAGSEAAFSAAEGQQDLQQDAHLVGGHAQQQRPAGTWVASSHSTVSRRGNQPGWGPRSHRPPPHEQGTAIPWDELGWLTLGATVTGEVVAARRGGFVVRLLQDRRVQAFAPRPLCPYNIPARSSSTALPDLDSKQRSVPVGLIREWEVFNLPPAVYEHGTGPILSASRLDDKIFGRRAQQIIEVCNEDHEVLRGPAVHVDEDGLFVLLDSRPMAIRARHVINPHGMPQYDAQAVAEAYLHQPIDFTPTLYRHTRNFTGSMRLARSFRNLSNLRAGALVRGMVNGVRAYGVFVGIKGTPVNGLLHWTNISRNPDFFISDLFKPGDEVTALVVSVGEGGPAQGRISLSTAELEESPGDMLHNKERVYANAEKQAEVLNEWLSSQESMDVPTGGLDPPA